jgi:hypothetical protein
MNAEQRANLETLWWLGMGGLLVCGIVYGIGFFIAAAYSSAGDFLQPMPRP